MHTADVVNRLRKATACTAAIDLSDKDMLKVALLCTTPIPEDYIAVAYNRHLSRQLDSSTANLALRAEEFALLFCSPSVSPTVRDRAEDALCDERIKQLLVRLEQALRGTLRESAQRAAWTIPQRRLAAVLSLRMNDELADRALSSAVGTLIRADLRRVCDLRDELHDGSLFTFELLTLARVFIDSL